MCGGSRIRTLARLGAAASLFLSAGAIAETIEVDADFLRQLKDLVEQQQEQLEQQQEQIKGQNQQMQKQSEELRALQLQVKELNKTATQAKETAVQALETAEPATGPTDRNITSGEDRVKVTISGQVNRAVNIVGDGGRNVKAYFVDNAASTSRFRIVGTAEVTDDLTFGTRLETAFSPNQSSQVTQRDEESGDFFDQRWAEVTFDSKTFGKLSLGKGDTASNNTSEVDLSGTAVVAYSAVGDIAGGLFFRDNDENLTSVQVKNAFTNFDGLSRKTRVRYDTPAFQGFQLAGSVISDDRIDGAVFWGAEIGDFQAAAALAVADINESKVNYRLNGSASVLHQDTGLNLTVAGGFDDKSEQGDPQNFFVKLGWIANFFDFGQTAFTVDFTQSTNNPERTDKGNSYAGTVVQQVNDFGTEFFAQVRAYTFDRNNDRCCKDIVAGTVGSRIKF